jgi:(2Fe-2S) ferredoxin
MVIYPDAIWYRYQTRADVDEILDSHVVHGRPAERLILRPSDGPFRTG